MRGVFLSLAFIISFPSSANTIKYPARAEQLRIDGVVTVNYDINEHGRVSGVRIINSEPKYVFERSVEKQISNWNFPANEPKNNVVLRIIFDANHKGLYK